MNLKIVIYHKKKKRSSKFQHVKFPLRALSLRHLLFWGLYIDYYAQERCAAALISHEKVLVINGSFSEENSGVSLLNTIGKAISLRIGLLGWGTLNL